MLKVKDNVDLKELEKFGFKKMGQYYLFEMDEDLKDDLWCYESDKSLEIHTLYAGGIQDIDILYDLIKADLIEKVDE